MGNEAVNELLGETIAWELGKNDCVKNGWVLKDQHRIKVKKQKVSAKENEEHWIKKTGKYKKNPVGEWQRKVYEKERQLEKLHCKASEAKIWKVNAKENEKNLYIEGKKWNKNLVAKCCGKSRWKIT